MTRRPRSCVGATSEMYMGTIAEATPTASPRTTRESTRIHGDQASAAIAAPTANTMAACEIAVRRPTRSASFPPIDEPKAAPTSSDETMSPTWNELRCIERCMKTRAPEMTPVS